MTTNEIANDDFSSQLRSLRLLLGKNYRPVSTTTLASITGIPATAIQAIEANRRELHNKDREKIAGFIGARWNETTHQWGRARQPEVPYSRSYYEKHSQWVRSSELTDQNAETLIKSISTLLRPLDPRDAADATLELHFEVERIAREKNLRPDTLEILQSLRSSLIAHPPRNLDETEEPISTPKKPKAHGPTSQA